MPGPARFDTPPGGCRVGGEKKQKLLAELKPMSTNALKMEAQQWSERLGDMIDLSWLDHEQGHQAVAQAGAYAKAAKRRQRKDAIIKKGRSLLAEDPKLRAGQIYDLLELHDGIIKFTSFERHWLPEIRKIYDKPTLAG